MTDQPKGCAAHDADLWPHCESDCQRTDCASRGCIAPACVACRHTTLPLLRRHCACGNTWEKPEGACLACGSDDYEIEVCGCRLDGDGSIASLCDQHRREIANDTNWVHGTHGYWGATRD